MKTVIQTPKGFRDFLPEDARVRESVITTLKEVFSSYGFAPLETPAIEYEETLLGKYGEEAEKLIYLFKDRGGRDVGLRYDLTVPLARVVAQYQDKLPIPFKRYQIAPVWRAEKPQAGRFREFWQADIDTVGTASPLADAEIIACAIAVARRLGFQKATMNINDRNIFVGIETKYMIIIDKLPKIGREAVEKELIERGMTENEAKAILTDLLKQKPTPELNKIFTYLKSLGFVKGKDFKFDQTIVRGIEYYTGAVFELVDESYSGLSLGGGGRYNKLIGKFAGQDLPTVGFSFGIDRVIEALKQTGVLIEKGEVTAPDILITVFDEKLVLQSIKLAKKLREEGFSVELYPAEQTKLEKQLKYADKRGIQWVVIIGPEELKSDRVLLRNMETGEQTTLTITELIKKLS